MGAKEFKFVDFIEGMLELAEQVDQLVIIILVPHKIESIEFLGLKLASPRLKLEGEVALDSVPCFTVLFSKVDDGLDEHFPLNDVGIVLERGKGHIC